MKGNKKQKVVAFVPMKMNNERLPGKNTMILGDKPLYKHILDTLENVEEIDEIYVYCSDDSIANQLGDKVKFLKRGKWLDQSSTPILDVCTSFMLEVDADIYILTHATAPFISEKSFRKGIEKVKGKKHDSAMSVKAIQGFLWKNGSPLNYSLSNIPRTQDLEIIYEETCGMFIWEKSVLLKKKRRIGDSPYMVKVSEFEAVDIDNEDNFIFAQAVYMYNQSKNKK